MGGFGRAAAAASPSIASARLAALLGAALSAAVLATAAPEEGAAWLGNELCFGPGGGSGGISFGRCCRSPESRAGAGVSGEAPWSPDRRSADGASDGEDASDLGCWGDIYDPTLCCLDAAAAARASSCADVSEVPFAGFWPQVERNLSRLLDGDPVLWSESLRESTLFDYTQMLAFGECPLGALALRLFHLVSTVPDLVNGCAFRAEVDMLKAVPWRLLILSTWGSPIFRMLAMLSDGICALARGHERHLRCEAEELDGVAWTEQVAQFASIEELEVDVGNGRREWWDRSTVWGYWVQDPGAPQDAWDQRLVLVLVSKAYVQRGPDAAARRDSLVHAAQQLLRRPAVHTLSSATATHRRYWEILFQICEQVRAESRLAQHEELTGIGDVNARGPKERAAEARVPSWLARPALQRSPGLSSAPFGLPLDLARQLDLIVVDDTPTSHHLCSEGGFPLATSPGTQATLKVLQGVVLGASLRRWRPQGRPAASSAGEAFEGGGGGGVGASNGGRGGGGGWVVEIDMFLIDEQSDSQCRHDSNDRRRQYSCEQEGCGHFLELACSADGGTSWVAASVHSSMNWMRPISPNLVECPLPAGFDPGEAGDGAAPFVVLLREAQGLWRSDVKVPLCRHSFGASSAAPSLPTSASAPSASVPARGARRTAEAGICLRPLFRMDSPAAGWILRDWLRYHVALGFGHFVFYDTDGTLRPWLEEAIAAGLVSYFPFVFKDMPRIAEASDRMLAEEGVLWGIEMLVFEHCLFWLRSLGVDWGMTIQAPDKFLVGPARGQSLAAFLGKWAQRPEVSLVYLRDRRFRGLVPWPSSRAETPAMLRFALYEQGLEKDGRKAPWVAAFRPGATLHVQGHTARPRAAASSGGGSGGGGVEAAVDGEHEDELRTNHYLEIFGKAGRWREAGGVQHTRNGSAFDEEILWVLPLLHCWRAADLSVLGADGALRPEVPLFSSPALELCGLLSPPSAPALGRSASVG